MRQFLREMRALVWKEWRQGWKVLALAVLLSVGTICGAVWIFSHEESRETLIEIQIIVWMLLAVLFGAPLFAGEEESRGMVFLVTQPVRPFTVWLAKALSGLLFLAVFGALLATTRGGACCDNRAWVCEQSGLRLLQCAVREMISSWNCLSRRQK